ncbi:MAG: hypothetical protein ACFE0P_15780 [Oceanicaulis sp.]
MLRLFMILAATVSLSACASYPERTVTQGGERGAIALQDAPAGAELFVNGASMGPAAQYDGEAGVLELERGRYLVEVRVGAQTIFQREVYLGDAVMTLDVR